MVNYGKYIKINRYLQKKSISELCDGICTPSTLSKIENNKSNINPKIINQILERLSNINIDILESNTNRLKPVTELFMQRLIIFVRNILSFFILRNSFLTLIYII